MHVYSGNEIIYYFNLLKSISKFPLEFVNIIFKVFPYVTGLLPKPLIEIEMHFFY